MTSLTANDRKTLKAALEVLVGARELIAAPFGWTRYTSETPSVRSPHGYAFCASGALCSASGWRIPRSASGRRIPLVARNIAFDRLSDEVGCDLTDFNDAQKDKRPVLRLFDRVIKNIEKELAQ